MKFIMDKLYQKILLVTGLLISTSAFAGNPGTMTYGPAGNSVPTLSGSMMIVLAILMAVIGYRVLKQKSSGGTMATVLLSTAIMASGAGGIKLIADAYAHSTYELDMASGGQVAISGSYNDYPNTSGVKLKIVSIVLGGRCDNFPDGGPFEVGPECVAGLELLPGSTCVIDCSFPEG